MSRKFTVPAVLRKTSNPILEKVFRQLGADTSPLEWEKIGKRNPSLLYNYYNALPPVVQDQIDLVLQDIYEIACDEGISQLDEVAQANNQEYWSLWFQKAKGINASPFSKAAWLWIMFPETFQRALDIFRLTHMAWWRPRTGLVRMLPTFDAATKMQFETALRQHMFRRQCRGRFCNAEMTEHGDGVYYFLVEISDFARQIRYCTSDNEAKTLDVRSLCRIVYAYDSNTGILRLRSGGTTRLKEELEEIFIRAVLGEIPIPLERLCCNLHHLKSPTFSTATNPEDGIKISVQQLIFQDNLMRELSFKVPYVGTSVYQMIHDYFGGKNLLLRNASVILAKLRFEFLRWGECRKGSYTFEVRHGGGYVLRNQDDDRVEMIRKYMRKMGIEHEQHHHTPVVVCGEQLS